jgi:hypothetical protein
MTDTLCAFGDRRDETLVAYLYDEIDSRQRLQFERHLSDCATCRAELVELSGVRSELGAWAAPEVAEGVGGRPPRVPLRIVEPTLKRPAWQRFGDAPVWLQAAAAMLVVGAALGAANLNVTYTRGVGLSVTTGWWRPPIVATSVADTRLAAAPDAAPAAEWREELRAVEQRLEQRITTGANPEPASGEALLKQVRSLIQESERRQQRELALRVAEVAQEHQTQRQADLVRIDRSLGLMENRTGVEMMRTQQQLNSLAIRVSQQR